jgi:hypothetical protein
LPLFLATPQKYQASIALPTPEKQDQTEANRERDNALRALGYLH